MLIHLRAAALYVLTLSVIIAVVYAQSGALLKG